MNIEKIGILGYGGQAREAHGYARSTNKEVEFFAVNAEYLEEGDTKRIDIVTPDEYQRILPVVAAIGAPAVRKEMVDQWSGDRFDIIKSNDAYLDDTSTIGEGSIISPRAVITANSEIGKHVIVNVAATISHDCKIGDYVTVSPGAHIAGNVSIGEGAFIGIGATITNNIKIAPGVVVGAGSVVLKDIEQENAVVVGSPARVLRINEGWLREV